MLNWLHHHGLQHTRLQRTGRPHLKAIAACAAMWTAMPAVHAEGLVELYQAAKAYDATYLAAKAQAEATGYKPAQAKSTWMPQVGLQASATRSHMNSSAPAPYGADVTGTRRNVAVQATEALFNKTNWDNISQSEQAVAAAQADLKMAEDDLAVRVTQAYFDVLSAQDLLTTAQANKKALAEQLAAAKRNFEVGNATITDSREAQARFDLASAQEIAAANDLQVKRIALDQLVGRANVQPDPLQTPVNLSQLNPGQVDEWVNQSAQAPIVQKAQAGLEIARLETSKARDGHLPTVDLVGSVSKLSTSGYSTLAQATMGAGTTSTIGVQLNVPLFAGFAVQNRVKETLVLEQKAESDLDNAKRSVALGTRQAYYGVQSGLAQVQAYEAAESSAKLALEATQLGYRVGVRINKDVLDAQTQLASTQRDLYKARYDVIMATVKLRQASGTLKPDDLGDLNKLLAAPAK
ncbi:MAG TPA: TolC family outer membrane protein [Aquabacterium sp.]|nr:TolC family outer membrane protein [Aquabacterium sp.]